MRLLSTRFSPGCLGIAATCALIVMLGWALTLERIRYEREDAVQGAIRQNANLALAFEEHTKRTLRGVDRVLRYLRHEYQQHGGVVDARYLAREALLDAPALATAGIIDQHGKVIISMTGVKGISVADREYFQHHRDSSDDELRIGTPDVGRVTGRSVIHLTRRIQRDDGSFAGVAIVGIDPQYFARFYSELDLSERGSIVLAGLDGYVRAHRTGMLIAPGADLAGSPLFAQLGHAPVGSYVGSGHLDGVERYLSYRQLKDYPLVVVVGSAKDDVLAAFAERRQNYLAFATLATLFVLMSGSLLLLARRRQKIETAGKLAAEARYRATFDHAAVGVTHAAPDGRFLRANPAYCAMLGYTEAELLQRRFLDVIHEEDRGMAEKLRSHFLSGDALSPAIEHREVRKDGGVLWMSVAVSMVRDATGSPEYFIAMVRDISKRKQAEEAVRESEARFRQLAENVREVFWLTDPTKSQMLYVSPAYEQIWGRSCDELYSSPREWARAIHPEDRERVLRAAQTRQASGEYVEEYRIVRPDGEVRWIRDRAFPVARNGEVYRIAGVAEDITERRLADGALRESEARFRSLTELSSDFYWETDAEHRFQQRGSGGRRSHVGVFEQGRQIGKRRWEIPSLSPDEAGWRAHRECLDAHQPFRGFELSRRGDDGTERFISLSADPVFDAGGSFRGYRGVGTDITERKRAELQLRESERRFRDILGKVQLVSLMLDRDARITYCNDYLLELTGWKREEVIGRDWFELFIAPGPVNLHEVFAALLADQPAAWHHENEILTRAGGRRLVRWNNTVLRSISGEVIGTASLGEDITEQRSTERARLALAQRAAAQAYALGAVSSSDALAAGEVEQVARLVTELAAGATGVARANAWLFNADETELTCIDLFEADGRRHSAGARLAESQFANEFRALKSARYVNADDPLTDPRTAGYVESYVKPLGITSMLDVVVQVSGKHLGLLCLEHVGPAHRWSEDEIAFACQLADKIALALTNCERRVAEARYRATFEQSATGIVHASLEGMILSANRKFCRMLGYDEREVVGRGVDELTHAEDRSTTLAAARQLALHTEDSFVPEYEKRYVRKDGSALWVALSVCVVRDARGLPQYFIGLTTDITARKQAEEQLLRLAHHDALTDLPNRVLCFDRLSQAIAQASRKHWNAGVLFLDLDRFKVVNDTLGHTSGDAVLRLAAERLQGCVRAGDTVARVGGDEFVVVLAELTSPQHGAVVAKKIVDAMAQPLRYEGQEIYITTSIGIATYPGDGTDGDTLVKNADAAMLRAKESRNGYQFYTAEMNERAVEKLQLETDLRGALERREFFLHFQPKVSLPGGRVIGMEALLRWNRPGRGAVSPAQFVPILEDCGLIVPVGDWIVDAACAQIRAWRDAGLDAVPVAVNLAAKQFLHHDIGAVIDGALARHGIPGSLLEIEITESDAMASPEQVSAVLSGLKQRGVTVAIDDFGTGYSSLGYLKRFPLDTLKLDRSFVTGLPDDGDDVSIALAVIGMAHSLGLKVVAEGVEKAEQRDFLSAHGCDEMQGYLFSRPVPAGECAKFLAGASGAARTLAA